MSLFPLPPRSPRTASWAGSGMLRPGPSRTLRSAHPWRGCQGWAESRARPRLHRPAHCLLAWPSTRTTGAAGAGTRRHGRSLPGREPNDGAEGGPQGRQLPPLEPQEGAGAVPPRDPLRSAAPSPQHRHRLLGDAGRREHRFLDAVRRWLRPVQARRKERPIGGRPIGGQTLFLVSKTARKNQEQSLTPSPGKRGGHATDGSQVTTDGLREITAPRLPGLARDTWQRVEIIAIGNVIRMLVDDREVSAFQDTGSRLKRGQVAIRLRNGGQIEVRKIEIKELTGKGLAGD